MRNLALSAAYSSSNVSGLAGFRPKDGQQIDLGGVKVHWFEKSLSVVGVAYLASMSVKALTTGLFHQYRYFGWDSSKIVSLMNVALEPLQAVP